MSNDDTADVNDTNQLSSNCIGKLEHHVHDIFASARVPGEDFVYSSSTDLFSIIDEYCNDGEENGPKPPLLLLGEEGTGKSALLSNWLQRKHRNGTRIRQSLDEFIFWHAVGCSRHSMNVNNLIRRLIVDLKNRFELSREVPVLQERLSWELPRFLDLASKRGKIIVIIDGVNRLVSNDDSDASLAWLPLVFPPNVRVVLSATVPSLKGTFLDPKSHAVSEKEAKDAVKSLISPTPGGEAPSNGDFDSSNPELTRNHILSELKRRKWKILRLRPLDRNQCKSVVQTFVHKTVQAEASSFASGPFLTAVAEAHDGPQEIIPGFLLFDKLVLSLLSHPHGGTPLFLRLFLRCSHLMCTRGASLWHLWDDWLRADNVPALLNKIMTALESGSPFSPDAAEVAKERVLAAGGLTALRRLYPWHPSFHIKDTPDNDTSALGNFEYSRAQNVSAVVNSEETPLAPIASGHAADKLHASHPSAPKGPTGGSLLQSLGDQRWLATVSQAEAMLELARRDVSLFSLLLRFLQNSKLTISACL